MEMQNESVPLEVRIIGFLVTSVAAVLGMFTNLALILVSLRNFASFRRSPFFLITWQMLVGDLMVIIAELTVAVPITLAGYNVYENAKAFADLMTLFDSFGYMGNMFFALLLILNRFFIFCMPKVNVMFFGRRSTIVTIAVTWAFVAVRVLYVTFSGCTKLFLPHRLHFRPSCRGAGNFPRALSRFSMYESYVLPGLMFILYIVVLVKVRYELRTVSSTVQFNSKNKTVKLEIRLLIQSILICGMLQIEALSFALLPKIEVQPAGRLYLNLLKGLISIINSTIHPIVLFVFNNDVRQGLLRFMKKPTSVAVQHLSVSQSNSAKVGNRASQRRSTLALVS